MMLPVTSFDHYFNYFLKRDISKFYIAVGIRNLALGMVVVFEPIYLYLFFGNSIPLTLLYLACIYGLYGLLVVWGGRIMGKIGPTRSILASTVFYIGYYVFLQLFPVSPWFVPLAIVTGVIGMLLFWPAFHTDFVRFSSQEKRGRQVGSISMLKIFPTMLAPFIGGAILLLFGYPALFTAVFVVLLASSIPLFYAKETKETYTDSYQTSWARIFKKENRAINIAFVSESLETTIQVFLWPLFLFILAVSFVQIGIIASFALFLSGLFMLYVGKIADTEDRPWLLNVGAVWTAIAWVLKSFVQNTFDALLAQTIYRISRSAAAVPFVTYVYEKAAARGEQADEFIVYREVITSFARGVFFVLLALVFYVFPHLSLGVVFFAAAILSLGFMFLGNLPKFKLSDI